MLAPLASALLEAAELRPGERVLDVGCGCGATSLAAAVAVGPDGAVLGVDLSEKMLDVARSRARAKQVTNVAFVERDAQALAPDNFDAIISRLGIMFFPDPARAFAALRACLHPGGRLTAVVWQELAANEWIFVPGLAIASHLPLPAAAGATGPGPFALSDRERTVRLLAEAGFERVAVESRTASVLLGGPGSVEDAVEFLRTGGLGRAALDGADERTRAKAVGAVRRALAPYHDGEGVRLGAAVWLISAHRNA